MARALLENSAFHRGVTFADWRVTNLPRSRRLHHTQSQQLSGPTASPSPFTSRSNARCARAGGSDTFDYLVPRREGKAFSSTGGGEAGDEKKRWGEEGGSDERGDVYDLRSSEERGGRVGNAVWSVRDTLRRANRRIGEMAAAGLERTASLFARTKTLARKASSQTVSKAKDAPANLSSPPTENEGQTLGSQAKQPGCPDRPELSSSAQESYSQNPGQANPYKLDGEWEDGTQDKIKAQERAEGRAHAKSFSEPNARAARRASLDEGRCVKWAMPVEQGEGSERERERECEERMRKKGLTDADRVKAGC